MADTSNDKRKKYTVRSSYYNQAKHMNDFIMNLGYEYRGNLFKNTTSPELWANPLQIPLYGRIEAMITYVLEQVKTIKKTFSIAHDKNTLDIN